MVALRHVIAQADSTLEAFWVYWPWWSGSLFVAMTVVGVGLLVYYAYGKRRRALAAAMDRAGYEAQPLDDRQAAGEELDDLLGGSVLYRGGYITRIDGWWRKREGELIMDVIDYREMPVPGGPRREDEAAAYYDRQEMTDRSETLVVFRHEQFAALPRFLLVPNNVLMATMSPKYDLLKFGNIKFNRRNRITSPEQGETHNLFDRELQKMLIDNRKLSIESFADALVFAHYGSSLWPGQLEQVLKRGRAFCDYVLTGEAS